MIWHQKSHIFWFFDSFYVRIQILWSEINKFIWNLYSIVPLVEIGVYEPNTKSSHFPRDDVNNGLVISKPETNQEKLNSRSGGDNKKLVRANISREKRWTFGRAKIVTLESTLYHVHHVDFNGFDRLVVTILILAVSTTV